MSTSQTILENAQYHANLLKTLDELSYAPSAFSQQTSYLADLEGRVKSIKADVEKLSKVTKKERKEHESLRDSTARRLAAKMTGKKQKFEEKREKEEKEYVEALEKEMKERDNLKTVETMIAEGRDVKEDLSRKSQRLAEAEREIHALYERIFDGPTQEFPRDDQLESQLEQSQQAYNRIQDQMNRQSRAVNLLKEADNAMRHCLAQMQEALSYSTWDVYGGGTMADMMERSALGNAAIAGSRAQMLVNQAQQTSPDVRNVGPIRVYEISMFGDVFFDNIFSDIAAHNKMEANRNELMQHHDRIIHELRAATSRCERIGPDLIEASEVLSQCRRDLDQFRRETFQRVSGMGGAEGEEAGAPPPQYFPREPGQDVPPPAFPEPTSTSSVQMPTGPDQYSPPTGPPPGHDTGAGTSQTQFNPPTGPPPGHEPEANGNAGGSTQYQPPLGPPPGHLERTESSVPKHWGSSAFQPFLFHSSCIGHADAYISIPSENPFALSLVGDSAHMQDGASQGTRGESPQPGKGEGQAAKGD
ncbi:hypothetical protein PQX77_020629 [Marasmius sp. AFHP31]|nr:hypothetical protein PQX77_020629 [Marasmius sp. AFHP31]